MSESTYYENPLHWQPDIYASTAQQQRYREILALFPSSIKSLLDVGCGNGMFLKVVRDSRHILPIGLERSQTAVRIGAEQLGQTIVNGDIAHLPFSDRTFDAVSALEVLEHLPEPLYHEALAEISRVSCRYILVNVPFREHRFFIRCPSCGCGFPNYFHLRCFTEHKLANLFSDFRLKQSKRICVVYQRPLNYLWTLWRRRFGMPFDQGMQCPLCSFSLPDQKTSPDDVSRRPLVDFGRRCDLLAWPKFKVAEEVVCLYERY